MQMDGWSEMGRGVRENPVVLIEKNLIEAGGCWTTYYVWGEIITRLDQMDVGCVEPRMLCLCIILDYLKPISLFPPLTTRLSKQDFKSIKKS